MDGQLVVPKAAKSVDLTAAQTVVLMAVSLADPMAELSAVSMAASKVA